MQNKFNLQSKTFLQDIHRIAPYAIILVVSFVTYASMNSIHDQRVDQLKTQKQDEIDVHQDEESKRKEFFLEDMKKRQIAEEERRQKFVEKMVQEEKFRQEWKDRLVERRRKEDRDWAQELEGLRREYREEQTRVAQLQRERRRAEERRLEQSRRENAYQYAEKAKYKVINEVYDGGQNKAVDVVDWKWLGNGYRIDLNLSWNGATFSWNSYAADGYITCDANGRNVKWHQTWASSSVKDYMSKKRFWTGAAMAAIILSNID